MNFDFSALLVLLTFASGAIWALDSWVLGRKRRKAATDEDGAAAPPEPVLVEYARSFFPVFLIVLILRSFIVEPFRIPSASMMPTLLIGDFILVNKYDYGIRLPVIHTKIFTNKTPKRGDIIVFRYPEDPSIPYIKRVVGLPGDHVRYYNKSLYINDILINQDLKGEFEVLLRGGGKNTLSWREEHLGKVDHDILIDPDGLSLNVDTWVPEGQYFVLGDNRDNSKDSRYWGFVPDENLVGRAFMIWMNWNSKNGGIHWSRIGNILN